MEERPATVCPALGLIYSITKSVSPAQRDNILNLTRLALTHALQTSTEITPINSVKAAFPHACHAPALTQLIAIAASPALVFISTLLIMSAQRPVPHPQAFLPILIQVIVKRSAPIVSGVELIREFVLMLVRRDKGGMF